MTESTCRSDYDTFRERRKELGSLLARQVDVLSKLGNESWRGDLQKVLDRLTADSFKVLVLGEFKRGKSTFINAMLGEEVLPAYAKPCTAVINEIKWGGEKRAVVHFSSPLPMPLSTLLDPAMAEYLARSAGTDVPPLSVPVEQLRDVVTIKGEDEEQQKLHAAVFNKVELFWPIDLCRNGVEIIDSPGLNEHEVREKVTLGYLAAADAVLFVFSCEALGSTSELNVIDNILLPSGHEDVFFICNRFHLIRSKEREELQEYAHKRLDAKTKRGAAHVFFVDSLDALEGKQEADEVRVRESGLPQVQASLGEFLTNERGRVKLLRPARELKQSIRRAKQSCRETREMLRGDAEALRKRYEEAEQPLKALEREREQIFQRMNQFVRDTQDGATQRCRIFFRTLIEDLPVWVKDYQLKNTVTWGSLLQLHLKEDVIKASGEIAKSLCDRVEQASLEWQRKDVQPYIQQQIGALSNELDARIRTFMGRLDAIRCDLTGCAAVSTGAEAQPEPSPLERVLAAAGGAFMGGFFPAVMGGVFGAKEMFKSVGIAIAALAAGILIHLTPVGIIALVMGAGFANGLLKMKATNDKIKEKVLAEFIKQLADNLDTNATTIGNAVAEKIGEVIGDVNKGLAKEIHDVRQQVESVLCEKQHNDQFMAYRTEQLVALEKELDKIDAGVDDLIVATVLV